MKLLPVRPLPPLGTLLAVLSACLLVPAGRAQIRVDGSNLGTNVNVTAAPLTSNTYTSIGDLGGPFSTLNVTGPWYISFTANGSLDLVNGAINVNGGSLVTHDYVGIGKFQPSGSRIELTNGATFLATEYVGVGVDNNGGLYHQLQVKSGSQYLNTFGTTIAENSGSAGILTVTGAGSTAQTTNYLNVGYRGHGILNVLDGATATHTGATSSFNAGALSGSYGQVSIQGAGSKFTAENHAEIGGAGQGSLTLSNGGEFVAQRYLGVGQNAGGLGGISITTGGKLTVGDELHLGEGNGGLSTGTFFISGAGSQVTARGLVIGQGGNGAMNVQNGALVLVDGADGYKHLTLGGLAGSGGGLYVSGAGSTVQVKGDAYIGQAGSGGAYVQSGGLLDVSGNAIIGGQAGSDGTLSVTGPGSTFHLGGGYLGVGQGGNGSLVVAAGGALQSDAWISVGNEPGSLGSATITGAGSTLTGRGIAAAAATGGTGLITVSDGALVQVSEWVVSNGTGTNLIDVTSGGRIEAGLGVTMGGPGHGRINVDGAGSNVTAHLNLDVGWEGSAEFNVTNGASAHADGTFSTGVSHAGVSNISGGSTVSAGTAIFVGGYAGATGTLNLAGAGTVATAPWISVGYEAEGRLNLLDQATLNTTTLTISRGAVVVDGGNLNAGAITIGTDGALAYNRTGAAAGSLNAASIDNAGRFTVNTAAPAGGTPDARTIGGSVHNAASGNVAVNLQDNAHVTFTGPVTNDGVFKVTQEAGTSGGVTTFAGTFTNNGTFTQDPTTTHFAELFNAGYFSAGEGDQVIVDGAFHNDGHLSLTRALLDTGEGLLNNGFVDVFGGAEILGDYSGLGALIFHIGSAGDQLVINDGFSGRLELVFDPGYSLLGTENFIFFGQGAYLSSLLIGGVDYGALAFSGNGYLTGNGSFVAGPVPDSAGTLALFSLALGVILPVSRRRTRAA